MYHLIQRLGSVHLPASQRYRLEKLKVICLSLGSDEFDAYWYRFLPWCGDR